MRPANAGRTYRENQVGADVYALATVLRPTRWGRGSCSDSALEYGTHVAAADFCSSKTHWHSLSIKHTATNKLTSFRGMAVSSLSS
jgi:hypothetical protein